MRRGQARAELPRDLQRLIGGQPADAPQQRAKVFAVDILPSRGTSARRLRPVVDAAHVGMRNLPGRCVPLAEARQRLLIGAEGGGQELQRHGLFQRQILGAVHLAHPAAPQQRHNAVPPAQHLSRSEPPGRFSAGTAGEGGRGSRPRRGPRSRRGGRHRARGQRVALRREAAGRAEAGPLEIFPPHEGASGHASTPALMIAWLCATGGDQRDRRSPWVVCLLVSLPL